MEGPSTAGYVFFFFFFNLLSGFRGFLKLYQSPWHLWMLILFLMYSILCSEALLQRCLFFFLQPLAGLTNRVPVRDSRAGAPLSKFEG